MEMCILGKKELKQRPLSEDDVCPICQETLLTKRQPVTYCRYVFNVFSIFF